MKKTIILLGSVLVLSFTACNKKEKTQDSELIITETVEDKIVTEGLGGSWELAEINTDDTKNKTINELYPENLPSLNFQEGLQVNGNDGCNKLMGSYELLEGNGIAIGEKLISTRMFCEGVADVAFNKALVTTNNYVIEGDTLFFKLNDIVILKFTKTNAQ